MRLIPVLSELNLSRGLIPFKKPGEETIRKPSRGIPEEEGPCGRATFEHSLATKHRKL